MHLFQTSKHETLKLINGELMLSRVIIFGKNNKYWMGGVYSGLQSVNSNQCYEDVSEIRNLFIGEAKLILRFASHLKLIDIIYKLSRLCFENQ